MAFDQHKNLALSVISTAPSPPQTGTSLTVATGEGTRFPVAPFNVTVWPINVAPTPLNAEVLRVVTRTGDTMSGLLRAQEGTTARAIGSGDQIAATITAKTLSDVEAAFSTISASTITTGRLPDPQHSLNLPWLSSPNNFTASPQNIVNQYPVLGFHDPTQGTDLKRFDIAAAGQIMYFRAINDAASIVLAELARLNRAGDLTVGRSLYERGRGTALGEWTTVALPSGWTGTYFTSKVGLTGHVIFYGNHAAFPAADPTLIPLPFTPTQNASPVYSVFRSGAWTVSVANLSAGTPNLAFYSPPGGWNATGQAVVLSCVTTFPISA